MFDENSLVFAEQIAESLRVSNNRPHAAITKFISWHICISINESDELAHLYQH